MNKTEIKNRLKEIIEVVEVTIENLEYQQKWIDETFTMIDKLEEHISIQVEEVFDHEELKQDIVNDMIKNELTDVYDITDDLRYAITSHADSLSETKRENMLEKYENLEHIVEIFSQDYSEYETIDEVKVRLDDAIEMIKELY